MKINRLQKMKTRTKRTNEFVNKGPQMRTFIYCISISSVVSTIKYSPSLILKWPDS